jgi:hypothetical protein
MGNTFDFEADSARKSGQPGRISETGAYMGKIVAAWDEESKGGAQSFNIKFKSDDGQEAVITHWVIGKDGKRLRGFNDIQALMACCGIRQIKSEPGTVKLYDRQEKKETDQRRDVYPMLAGKPVGLFLEKETQQYTDNDGKDQEFDRILLAAPFRYEDRKMAAEILDKRPKAELAERYEKFLMSRKPRVQDRREQRGNEYPDDSGVYGGKHVDSRTDYDDDSIPF